MTSSDRVVAMRWTLLALLLALPATVVCKLTTCTECEENPISDPASYETNFDCAGGDLTVTAGSASDVADAGDCSDVLEASASDTIDGVAAQVDFLAEHGDDGVTVTCAYHIGADLSEPITCDGNTLRPAEFFFLGGSDPVTWQITALRTDVADSADHGSFDPHVFVTCHGGTATEIAIGAPYTTPELPLFDNTCAIRIDMNSATAAAGATYHSITITLGDSTICHSNADCPGGLRCNSNGTCQDGGVGDPCSSSLIPTGGGDCGAAAPICVTGPGLVNARCSDGSHGSACAGDFHCASGSKCMEIFPGLGQCQDGSPIDLCRADLDCQPGCTCLKQGGTFGNCLGGCAEPGESGAFCTTALDCNPPWGCVSLGAQSICYRCSQNAQCATNESCVGGACQ